MDPISANVAGVGQLVNSKTNKVGGGVTMEPEGVEGEPLEALTLKLDDQELLDLAKKYEDKYAPYEATIRPRQEANKAYYLGRQLKGSPIPQDFPIAANLIFEAVETFIPAALAKNPEPVVFADNTTEGNTLSSDVKTMLQYHADTLVLRRKLSDVVRQWGVYYIGIMKHGWDASIGDITSEVRKPQNFIFNPDGYVDCYGDLDSYVGERITVTAERLVELFPKHKDYITEQVMGLMGTDVVYTEWWNDDYCFYTFKTIVLDKHKNQYFNYPSTIEEMDMDGQMVKTDKKGRNHFGKPKKPYTFLNVFSLREQPHDVTGLIEQNIPNQNMVSKRTMQIDRAFDNSNNGLALSADNFNEETGRQAAAARLAGRPILVPPGKPISEAIQTLQAPDVPAGMFNQLETNKRDLRSIFGVEGITSQPSNEDTTARGMILNQQFDNTRIGGGVGDALEQFADNVFNWWTQLYAVFYDEQHYGVIMGTTKATEYVTLTSQNMDRRLVVSVSPDSMKPKDEIAVMNQAMALWDKGALDPKTLFTILDFPDPAKTAESTVLWLLDKPTYLQKNFPELFMEMQQQAQMQAQQQMATGATPTPGGPAPVPASPDENLSTDPASAALSQVPLPQ